MKDISGQSKWYDRTTEANLTQLAEERDKRRQELDQVLQTLEKLERDDVVESNRYYPIRFLTDGVDAYINLFDNGTVFYASSAVELALTVRLAEKGALCGRIPNFTSLIKLAADNSVFDRQATKQAHLVRKMRNSYLHYYNIMRQQADVDVKSRQKIEAMLPKVKKYIRTEIPKPDQRRIFELVEVLESDLREDKILVRRKIPVQDVEPNAECRDFLEKRLKWQVRWVAEATTPAEVMRRYNYGIERRGALDCLHWSVDILIQLRFL